MVGLLWSIGRSVGRLVGAHGGWFVGLLACSVLQLVKVKLFKKQNFVLHLIHFQLRKRKNPSLIPSVLCPCRDRGAKTAKRSPQPSNLPLMLCVILSYMVGEGGVVIRRLSLLPPRYLPSCLSRIGLRLPLFSFFFHVRRTSSNFASSLALFRSSIFTQEKTSTTTSMHSVSINPRP